MSFLTAIPVYNEEKNIVRVLDEVRRYAPHLLLVNDGSADRTVAIIEDYCRAHPEADIDVVSHERNRGYGAALATAFRAFLKSDCEILVTMDCDGQHEPGRIPVLLEALGRDVDIISGSRYLREFRQMTLPTPEDRRFINQTITAELNEQLGLNLTDAFCGFKAYRRHAIEELHITEHGWGMPLQLWVQAAYHGLKTKEVGVPRLYLDPNRAFGGVLNDADQRLAYYRQVIENALCEESMCCGGQTCLA